MATARFLAAQKANGSAFVIGGGGLSAELYRVGYSLTDADPDYVVVGKTATFAFPMLRKAAQLIDSGAKFIGTNPDMLDPVEGGTEPAAGVLLAAIEAATGTKPYIVGKPNSLMMIYAREMLGVPADHCVMIGDRMDTDIVGGLEAGMRTCLVLSGVSTRATVEQLPLPAGLHLRQRRRHRPGRLSGWVRDGRPDPVAAADQAQRAVQAREVPAQERLPPRRACSTARAWSTWWDATSRSRSTRPRSTW